MKLYFFPGACSLSPHIALREAELQFTLEHVDLLAGRKLPDGSSYLAVNPKGYVPALALDDGNVLTEGAVIVQWIADQAPGSGLAPPQGTFERLRMQELLHFIATELHKGFGNLFVAAAPDELKQAARTKVSGRLALVSERLGAQPFIFGDRFTVADGYLFYVLRTWQQRFAGEMTPLLRDYYGRLSARPSVQASLAAEGLPAA
jgi:glutathione S-transferase